MSPTLGQGVHIQRYEESIEELVGENIVQRVNVDHQNVIDVMEVVQMFRYES